MQQHSHSLVQALRAIPDLADLNERTLLQIVGASSNLWWEEGAAIFEKGAPAVALYVVISGEVEVFDPDADGDTTAVGPGQFLGERSLLREGTHSRSARAAVASELLVLPADSFGELLAEHPELEAELRERTAS